jgi:putative flippase GtrA
MSLNTIVIEFCRFGIVGVVSNLILYLIYIILCSLGLGYKSAMTIIFILGVIQTFLINKTWTFNNSDYHKIIFFKYIGVYITGYFINLFVLIVAVDMLYFQHELVQGVMIITLGIYFFILQKFWVFKKHNI